MFATSLFQLSWNSICSIYPAVYIVSIPLTLALKRYSSYIGELWFVQFLENYIVRKYMFHWFTILYVLNLISLNNGRVTIPIKDPCTASTIKIFFVNLIWSTLLLGWCFGSPVFERISVATGAHCTVPGVYREYQCEESGGTWVNSFDPSSHYTMLISNSLLIWRLILPYLAVILPLHLRSSNGAVVDDIETGSLPTTINDEEGAIGVPNNSEGLKKIVVSISLLFLALWFMSFCITSIFYHTIPEKLVGLVCGMAIPLVSQYV